MPKIVFAGTAIAAMISVSFRACSASGVVTASHAGPKPCSNVRYKIKPTGATRRTPTYASDANRRTYLPIVPRGAPAQPPDQQQHAEGDAEQHDRHGRGARRIAALDPPQDVHRGHLGPKRD